MFVLVVLVFEGLKGSGYKLRIASSYGDAVQMNWCSEVIIGFVCVDASMGTKM